MAISMLKIRRSLGRLIFNMGIAIPGKTVFLIETAPWCQRLHYRAFGGYVNMLNCYVTNLAIGDFISIVYKESQRSHRVCDVQKHLCLEPYTGNVNDRIHWSIYLILVGQLALTNYVIIERTFDSNIEFSKIAWRYPSRVTALLVHR